MQTTKARTGKQKARIDRYYELEGVGAPPGADVTHEAPTIPVLSRVFFLAATSPLFCHLPSGDRMTTAIVHRQPGHPRVEILVLALAHC